MGTPTLRETLDPKIATALDVMLDAVQAWLRWHGDDGEHVTHILEPSDTFTLVFRISGSSHAWGIDVSDDAMNLYCMGSADMTGWWVPIEQVGYTIESERPRVQWEGTDDE